MMDYERSVYCFDSFFLLPFFKHYVILCCEKLFIPKYAAICSTHLEDDEWIQCKQIVHSNFSEKQNKAMLDLLLMNRITSPEVVTPLFTVSKAETGLTHDDFYRLLLSVPSLETTISNEEKRKIALKLYLTRLRTGDTLYRLRDSFQLSRGTQQNI